jgi:hypothetical protein
MIYGIIEDGVLKTQDVVERKERRPVIKKGQTVIQEFVISVEDQVKVLSESGWKPVDMIDETKLECEDGFAIRMAAVEYEDHIGFDYEKVIDQPYYRRKIQELKDELSSSDYKVIKCYEAYLVGEPMPYNAQELHSSRQSLRDSINALEDMIDNIVNATNNND